MRAERVAHLRAERGRHDGEMLGARMTVMQLEQLTERLYERRAKLTCVRKVQLVTGWCRYGGVMTGAQQKAW